MITARFQCCLQRVRDFRMGSFARLCLPIIAAAVCVKASSYTSSSVSCDDGEDYIPDSEDCTRFWRCANGKPYSFTCPAGLRFNVDISVCDWPDNVRCGATYNEDSSDHSEEDSDNDEEHDEDNSDEEEETTYPYQPGPKYYDRKYYTENPNYFKPTAAPVYRPIPTRRPVYKPVYISKPQTGYNSGYINSGQTRYAKASENGNDYNNNYSGDRHTGTYGGGNYKSNNYNSNYNSNKNFNSNENSNSNMNYQNGRGAYSGYENKEVYDKPVYSKPDFVGNYNKNYNNYQPPAYPQLVQGNVPWQQQQPYPLPVNNFFPVSGKQPLPWVPPLPAQPLPPPSGIGRNLPLESDTEVGKIPVLPKHFENQHLIPPYPVGGPLVPPYPVGGPLIPTYPVGGPFGQPLPLGKPLPLGPPFPIGKPVFAEQLFPGKPDHPIAIKPVNSQPILTHPLPIGSPQLGMSSLGQAFIPVIQKDPQLAKLYQQWNPVGPKGLPVSVDDYNLHPLPVINQSPMMNMHMNHGVGPVVHGPTFFQPHHDPFAGNMLVVEPSVHGAGSLSKILLPVRLVMTTASTTTTTTATTPTTTTTATTTTPTTATTTSGLPQGINIILLPLLPPILPPGTLPVPGTIISETPTGITDPANLTPLLQRNLLTNVLGNSQVTQGGIQGSQQSPDATFSRTATDPSSTCTARRNSQLVVVRLAQQSGRTLPERKCSALGQLLNSFVMVYVDNLPAQDNSPCVVEVPSITAQCDSGDSLLNYPGQG